MNRTTFSLEIFGDRLAITDPNGCATNKRQLALMKQALSKAIQTELTDRQRIMVNEYYFNGVSVTDIALKYGLSKSTVSRHLSRSRERLKSALKYGLYTLWNGEI